MLVFEVQRKRVVAKTTLLFLFGILYAYAYVTLIKIQMTDIDFIRFTSLAFTFRLIGRTRDPVSKGVEMAEKLFDKLKEKEV